MSRVAALISVLSLSGCTAIAGGLLTSNGSGSKAAPAGPSEPKVKAPYEPFKHAPSIRNPLVAKAVDDTKAYGVGSGNDDDVRLLSFKNDTLCVLASVRYEKSNGAKPKFERGIEKHYRLFAPTTMPEPYHTAESLPADKLTPRGFDASYLESTYEESGGKMVKRDRYDVTDERELCWSNVSRILKPDSTYLIVGFVFDNGSVDFGYAWKLGDAAVAKHP